MIAFSSSRPHGVIGAGLAALPFKITGFEPSSLRSHPSTWHFSEFERSRSVSLRGIPSSFLGHASPIGSWPTTASSGSPFMQSVRTIPYHHRNGTAFLRPLRTSRTVIAGSTSQDELCLPPAATCGSRASCIRSFPPAFTTRSSFGCHLSIRVGTSFRGNR